MPTRAASFLLIVGVISIVALLLVFVGGISMSLGGGGGEDNPSTRMDREPSAQRPSDLDASTPQSDPDPEVLRLPLDGDYSAEGVGLLWAVWGNEGNWVDASAYVRDELEQTGRFVCRGGAIVRAIGDPGVSGSNIMVVALDTPQGAVKLGLINGSKFRLDLAGPELNPSGGPLLNEETRRMNRYLLDESDSGNQILWARWGRSQYGNHWVDAYELTQGMLDSDGRIQNARRGLPLDHPAENRDKEMLMLVSMNGRALKFLMVGESWIDLHPTSEALLFPTFSDEASQN